MTPAKLMALFHARGERLELEAFPVDKLAWMYSNMNRDPGGKEENGSTRPPAPMLPMDDFRTLYNKRRTLAAKDGVYDHVLHGAMADQSAFNSWVSGKGKGK